ncbi:Uncharacterised protein [Streptococcus pneumoniae]|nr:Uncharacterised protein [Streptococcus pneumoniae]CEX44025.1 Uncharacterised protein [Streptococcus pneumoniae]CGE55823.1 Uncharacterised protein [Streptococcus pneumoniae]CGF52339.1 Uncharacterised protein [Streptococcus pneumoniae]CIN67428.1 Uncharacterised protein [Streptococcus pneumoniae]
MIDTPFQLLDSNSEETGLVCGIDGCSIDPSTQPLENTYQPLEKSKKAVIGRTEWKTKSRSLVRCYIGHYCYNYGFGVTVT